MAWVRSAGAAAVAATAGVAGGALVGAADAFAFGLALKTALGTCAWIGQGNNFLTILKISQRKLFELCEV